MRRRIRRFSRNSKKMNCLECEWFWSNAFTWLFCIDRILSLTFRAIWCNRRNSEENVIMDKSMFELEIKIRTNLGFLHSQYVVPFEDNRSPCNERVSMISIFHRYSFSNNFHLIISIHHKWISRWIHRQNPLLLRWVHEIELEVYRIRHVDPKPKQWSWRKSCHNNDQWIHSNR